MVFTTPIKKNIFTLGLIAILINLSACDLFSSPAEEVSFLNNKFSVIKPASWSIRTDLNDAADLQMGNLFKEAYVVILSENKDDFEDITLEEHSALTKSYISESLENYKETEPENNLSKKYKMIRYQISGTIEGLNVIYWHVSVETDHHFHQLLFWSLNSKFESNAADYNSVIQSFKANG
ncbi:hypothetical protein [Aurantivibrio infirmus]